MTKELIQDSIIILLAFAFVGGLCITIITLVLLAFEVHFYLGWLVIGMILLIGSSAFIDIVVDWV